MSAAGDNEDLSPDVPRPYGLTFGEDHTQTSWADRRHLSWPELTRLPTAHRVGPKAGPCIVAALLRAERRRQDEADRIDLALLDADAGHTLEEITAAITARGWRAAVASTHSHRTTRTTVEATHYDRWLARHPGRGAADYLLAVKHVLPRVAQGARLVERVVECDQARPPRCAPDVARRQEGRRVSATRESGHPPRRRWTRRLVPPGGCPNSTIWRPAPPSGRRCRVPPPQARLIVQVADIGRCA